VNHSGQLPSVTLSFNLAPGVSIGTAVNDVNKLAAQTLPSSVTTAFSGTVLAILVIYIVLGILYESFIHPITILSGLPFAGFGALLTLWLPRGPQHLRLRRHHHADRHREEERDHDDRLRDRGAAQRGQVGARGDLEACLIRFRPIMMTTMAALMGTLPIALGWRRGAPNRGGRWGSRWSADWRSRSSSRSTSRPCSTFLSVRDIGLVPAEQSL
jgi:HAE1 family hydrophobic/amphiphilic exporter-1